MKKSRMRFILGVLMACLCFYKGVMYFWTLMDMRPGSLKVVSALMAEENGGQISKGPTDRQLLLRRLEKYVFVLADATRNQAICDGCICLILLVFHYRGKRRTLLG